MHRPASSAYHLSDSLIQSSHLAGLAKEIVLILSPSLLPAKLEKKKEKKKDLVFPSPVDTCLSASMARWTRCLPLKLIT